MLFLPALSAACGLEAQEEIFPGNKFRCTELRLRARFPYRDHQPRSTFSRGRARTQDGYVFDRSYTSVADGETLKLPLAELKAYDYRFLMVAQPGRRATAVAVHSGPGHSSSRGSHGKTCGWDAPRGRLRRTVTAAIQT